MPFVPPGMLILLMSQRQTVTSLVVEVE